MEATKSAQELIDDLPNWDAMALQLFGAQLLARAGRDWPERGYSTGDMAALVSAVFAEAGRRRMIHIDI